MVCFEVCLFLFIMTMRCTIPERLDFLQICYRYLKIYRILNRKNAHLSKNLNCILFQFLLKRSCSKKCFPILHVLNT